MVVHHPNIRWIQAPTTQPHNGSKARDHPTRAVSPRSPEGYVHSPPGNLRPKRLIGLKTSSATAGIKVAWGLHKFNICDFLDKHVASAYVIALRRPHTQKHVNDTSNCEKRKQLPNPIHTIELLDVYEMVEMDKGYLPPAILSLIWAYAGGRSSWGFMLNNVNPYECPWLHWLQAGLSITTPPCH
jgi:hypothetical protein